MNADTVYQVAKALPREEQKLLFDKLKKDFVFTFKQNRSSHKKTLSKQEAFEYLIKNVFQKKKTIKQ